MLSTKLCQAIGRQPARWEKWSGVYPARTAKIVMRRCQVIKPVVGCRSIMISQKQYFLPNNPNNAQIFGPLFGVALTRLLKTIFRYLFGHDRALRVWRFLKKISLVAVFAFIGCLIALMDKAPITNRPRISVQKPNVTRQNDDIEEMQRLYYLEQSSLPEYHPYWVIVDEVIQNILKCNQQFATEDDLFSKYIITGHLNKLAYITKTGLIVLSVGMLDTMDNDHQLANVISHEMSHSLLDHFGEGKAVVLAAWAGKWNLHILNWIWVSNPGFALVISYLVEGLLYYALFAKERKDEFEADVVGMELAARAGYDPREHFKFEGLHDKVTRSFLKHLTRTHPSGADRVKHMKEKLPLMLEILEKSSCKQKITNLDEYR